MKPRGMPLFVAAAAGTVGSFAGREIWPREPRLVYAKSMARIGNAPLSRAGTGARPRGSGMRGVRYGSRGLVTVDTDRRASVRLPDNLPALFVREIGDPEARAATVRDLSDGGACVVAETAIPVGTELFAGFFLRGFGGLPLIAKVRVAWAKPEDDAHVMGLAFLAEGPAQRDSVERMRDYLAARRREMLAEGD